MFMDLTLTVPADFDFTALADDQELIKKLLDDGHIGTHFDVVDKVFPIESFRTNGKIFDISHIRGREAQAEERDLWNKYEAAALDKAKAAGNEIIDVADKKPFQDAVKPVWDKYGPKYADMIKRIQAVQ